MGKWSFSRRRLSPEEGFSLIEVLVSTVILVVGLVAMAELLLLATRMHSDAREATRATQLAQAQIDTLVRVNMATDARVQITAADTLSSNIANYFDTPETGITRRWNIVAGPVANTRILTVRVVNPRARQYGGQVDVMTILRQW